MKIQIGDIEGRIECKKIEITGAYRNYNGKPVEPIFKYEFKLTLNSVPEHYVKKIMEGSQKIQIDRIDYYLASWKINLPKVKLYFISYNLFDEQLKELKFEEEVEEND